MIRILTLKTIKNHEKMHTHTFTHFHTFGSTFVPVFARGDALLMSRQVGVADDGKGFFLHKIPVVKLGGSPMVPYVSIVSDGFEKIDLGNGESSENDPSIQVRDILMICWFQYFYYFTWIQMEFRYSKIGEVGKVHSIINDTCSIPRH